MANPITGYTSSKADPLALHANVNPVGPDLQALNVASSEFVELITTDATEASSTVSSIVATAHVARVGDLLRFSSGTNNRVIVSVLAVTADSISLGQDLLAAPSPGDTFEILRYRNPTVSGSGGVSNQIADGVDPSVLASVSPVHLGRLALDTKSHTHAWYRGGDNTEAGSTNTVINAVAHLARVGDYLYWNAGGANNWGTESSVIAVTADTIILGQALLNTPTVGDSFYIYRHRTPLVYSDGSVICIGPNGSYLADYATQSSMYSIIVTSTPIDNQAFTDGTTRVQMIGYVFDDTAGTALTENDAAAARIDSKRAQVFVIEDGTTRNQKAAVNSSGQLAVASDLRRGQTILFANIDTATSGDQTIVAADGTKKVKLLSYALVASGTVAVRWKSASTNKSGAMSLIANTGISFGPTSPGQGHTLETAVNEALILNLSTNVQVSGHISYFLEA